MLCRKKTYVFLLIIQIRMLQALSHTVDVRDAKVFEIALDDMNYDEEDENEMIQPADVADLKPLVEDENRYKALHSHVKYYNERNAEGRKPYPNVFLYLQPHAKEIFNLEQEDKPFIAGFKHELDKYFFKTTKPQTTVYITPIKTTNHPSFDKNKKSMQNSERLQNYRNSTTNVTTDKNIKNVRVKREEMENHYGTTLDEEMDFFQVIRDRNVTIGEPETTEYFARTQETHTRYDMYEYGEETTHEDTKDILNQTLISERSTIVDTESPDEESYDYEKFKMEYEQQLEYNIRQGKALNYTEKEKLEDTPKEALKRIMDLKRPKNCTKEELSQIGIKAIECLIYDYQRTKDLATIKKILLRTWLVLRVWLLIYICLAIPCWCQRGWCCCCFRCKFCFPRKRILFAKQYYTMNPPGTFVKDLKKKEEPVKYEVTDYEYDAYETFEVAIRNI